MKITAKGLISANPFSASQKIPKNPIEQANHDIKSINKELTTLKNQGQNVKTSIPKPVPLQTEIAQLASQETGGATYPPDPGQFQTISVVSESESRISNTSFLGYSYSLEAEIAGIIGTSQPPVDILTEVYLTIGVYNADFAYEYTQTGIDTKDKWVVWNSFRVGYYIYDSVGGVSTVRLNQSGNEPIRGFVDWTVPLEDRPIVGNLGFGSGINLFDFQNTDPTKITGSQFDSFVNGGIGQLKIAFGINITGLTAGQNLHLVQDVQPVQRFIPALAFNQTAILSNFN